MYNRATATPSCYKTRDIFSDSAISNDRNQKNEVRSLKSCPAIAIVVDPFLTRQKYLAGNKDLVMKQLACSVILIKQQVVLWVLLVI